MLERRHEIVSAVLHRCPSGRARHRDHGAHRRLPQGEAGLFVRGARRRRRAWPGLRCASQSEWRCRGALSGRSRRRPRRRTRRQRQPAHGFRGGRFGIFSRPPKGLGWRHRHQRQKFNRGFPAPDLGVGGSWRRELRHARRHLGRRRRRSRPHHCRSRRVAPNTANARGQRRYACGDGSFEPRAGARSRRGPPIRRRCLHQPHARSPRLSQVDGRVSRSQTAHLAIREKRWNGGDQR